jgi:hypothetical protein
MLVQQTEKIEVFDTFVPESNPSCWVSASMMRFHTSFLWTNRVGAYGCCVPRNFLSYHFGRVLQFVDILRKICIYKWRERPITLHKVLRYSSATFSM